MKIKDLYHCLEEQRGSKESNPQNLVELIPDSLAGFLIFSDIHRQICII